MGYLGQDLDGVEMTWEWREGRITGGGALWERGEENRKSERERKKKDLTKPV
jgi:hypothetical protein